MLEPDFAQKGRAQNDAVDAIGASVGTSPAPKHNTGDNHRNQNKWSVLLDVESHRQHEQRDCRQLCVQAFKQHSKLWNDKGKQKCHHHQHYAYQQRGINQ